MKNEKDNNTTTKEAELYEALMEALKKQRAGHATATDVARARRAYWQAKQRDPDTFDKQLEAGRKMVE